MSSLQQSAEANWPEDEARLSAKHWNEVIRFEDAQYRANWLAREHSRFESIFADELLFERYCDEFLKHRISE